MKKIVLVLVASIVIAGSISAQAAPWGPYPNSIDESKIVKVSGKLDLINGMIGISSGGETYYTPMLQRLVGFVDGLKEGASVKLEGYAYPLTYAPEYTTLLVTELTIGGKDYDLSDSVAFGHGGYGMRGGRWGRW